jgi:hypothetical protein
VRDLLAARGYGYENGYRGWLPGGAFGFGGPAGAGGGGAGQREDPATVAAKAKQPTHPSALPGFSTDFEIKEDKKANAIELDDNGKVVQPKRHAPARPVPERYLGCVNCDEPLLLSGAYRSPEDKVWVMRCGHVIDQRCLDKIGQPHSDQDRESMIRPPPAGLDILGAADQEEAIGTMTTKRGKAKRAKVTKSKKTKALPVEYEWKCPVEGCGRLHRSVAMSGEWTQAEGVGAMQMYA